ncbi:hypothetical protein Q3A66_04880 [Hymenobacter sp. BT770]|jgi:hypothetical protein|uniref:hypothetical protein n=1 Tax=Hymenobacter sp. BT770 TaxID=2886942 RepID=UPI001D10A497|nr:hypothetical protein [Hymenobacter sp. BT770]MCC3154162.1 hypothetical protein [Hymenobacter sp. BT770]MDO3414391.1 hypothetical protein [Hymenobacter sp. BT770]
MKLLSDSIADEADFFVEQIHIVAIVFDNTDDVTVWATTLFDSDTHFFHLALPFKALDTLLSLAHTRADDLQEEVAEALAAEEWPALLEYSSDEKPPVPLPSVALKLSVTYPATEDDETEGEEGPDDPQPHNIFYLEGVFVRIDT